MAARRKSTGKKTRTARRPAVKRSPSSSPVRRPAAKTKKPATKAKPSAAKAVRGPSKRVAEIQEIIDLMLRVGAVELETEDGKGGRLRVRLKEDRPPTLIAPAVAQQPVAALAPVAVPHLVVPLEVDAAAAPAAAEVGEPFVSPMVGSFYRGASPEAEPFAQVGDIIGEDTTICIIEAMKVMNEIKAEMTGTIAEILVEDGEPVEFGQPLFRVTKG